ncbi:flavin reductase family protein [Klugiella xanthotipulae]|uniref:Flavin reductase (DIM6/NTAB) family NADH-FMN oxidoreductase RutF n=1 Tax=Klugiella xanthotipulae TaxID=244735 RepID=A0A543HYS7_9MICO|nr:flavin reductase family protein [Klugiella xanthotipulae]TQM63492.1 flavin reductase (DIM6/NTAB) family NADH-FMN oxidoreductase RutF [Klugiella xanthotipulae]
MIATPDRSAGFRPESKLYRPPQHFFRGSLGRFATGVAIVTFEGESGVHGMTVNSFTSVSMDPPLVLVSIARSTRSHDELVGKPFAVNILGSEQRALALHFAGKPAAEPSWIEGGVAPRLAGTLSYFTCTPWADYDGGDHTLFLGEVQDYGYRAGDALGFVNGQFTAIPEAAAGHEDIF